MRKICLLATILTLHFSISGQNTTHSKTKSIWEKVSPPNGRHLHDSIFIDETEIANIHYLEYLYYVALDSSRSFYETQLPDSSCWQVRLQPKDSINKFIYHYFRYPGFRYYPVVGVSYEQALNYCKWRGGLVTKNMQSEEFYKKHKDLKEYDIRIEYRLPTKEEWEAAAHGGLDKTAYPYGLKRPSDSKFYTFKIGKNSCAKCLDEQNIKYSTKDVIHRMEFNVIDDFYFDLVQSPISCKKDTAFALRYIYDAMPNNITLFNMIGNVSEMTITKGIAKGGSFRNRLSDITIEKDFLYNGPNELLGFRCITIVHLKKRKKEPDIK